MTLGGLCKPCRVFVFAVDLANMYLHSIIPLCEYSPALCGQKKLKADVLSASKLCDERLIAVFWIKRGLDMIRAAFN
jgi:hypothetical protein